MVVAAGCFAGLLLTKVDPLRVVVAASLAGLLQLL
jgi:hypothetical protein